MDIDIQNHARANILGSGLSTRVGRFVCRFDPDSDNLFLNYAIPDEDTDPTDAELDELAEAFAAKGRVPRFEFLPTRSPKLADALRAKGYREQHRGRLMACAPGEVADLPLPAGLSILDATDEESFVGAAAVQHPAFDDEIPPRDVVIRSHTRSLERGGLLAVAVLDSGEIVGAGQTGPAIDAISEIGGIAVAPAYRRQGIAAALTAHLTRALHANGVRTAWLDPADDGAGRAYEKAGYRVVGEILHMVDDGAAS
ncbi:GNAT family N-acetyltransferase [Phytomonospora sp. NPDC050363]|uniref:GNAT family N-acetyltransferase n=1 Tax=Phytomonospora sp. NPDC050363 TaxID=3155642 RepID=UPI00340D4BF8